jgi:8-oxo-dGTP pyrophosphatase MutT (NUDIX family)
MKRSKLQGLLNIYSPADQLEEEHKNRIALFVDEHEKCFERSLDVGHVTASAWLLNNDQTKALLMHHTKLNLWVQPGGHCDGDSDALAVAIKEAQEESGISNIVPVCDQIFDVDVHFIPANSKQKGHYHYDIRFLLQVIGDEGFMQNHESKELRWVTKDRGLLPTTEQSVVRMFDKWLKRP